MQTTPSINIFRSWKTGHFSILRFTIDPESKLRVGFGKLIPVSVEQMRSNGLALVMQYLREFPTPMTGENCEAEKLSLRERSKFRREHKLVGVTQVKDSLLHLDPMRSEGNGWISVDEEAIEIRLPLPARKFFDALNGAFDVAQ